MAYVTVEGKQVEVKDQALDLSCMHIEHLSQIKGPRTLTQLESLDLSHNRLGPGELSDGLFKPKMSLRLFENMEWCFKLKHLDLSFNGIRQLKGIEYILNLEFLDLSHNEIRIWDELEVLSLLPHLKTLCIEGNRPYEINLSHNKRWWRVGRKYTTIPPLKIPQEIMPSEVLNNAIQAGKQVANRHVFKFNTQSESYDSFRCETVVKNNILDLTDFEIGITEPIEDCINLETPKIHKLILSNSYTFGKYFIGFEDVHPSLTLLDLSRNGLTEIRNGWYIKATYLPNLQVLNLSHNKLQSFDAISINLPNLEELNLSFNEIASLEGIEKFSELRKLNIHGNHVQHDDLQKLKKVVWRA